MKWQDVRKTIPRKATQHESQSQSNNENIAEEIAGQAILLTGLLLTQLSCIGQLASSLDQAVLSNLATPKTVEAWLYALSEMVNHTTNTCDQLRILALTLKPSLQISPNKEQITWVVNKSTEFLDEIVETFDLE